MNKNYTLFLLVGLGWFLNAKYYFSRYISEGFSLWLALIIAGSLVIFASLVFIMSTYYRKNNDDFKKWITIVIWSLLAIYSINCTIAGQYWDQEVRNTIVKTDISLQENQQYLTSYYEKNINKLQIEYDNLESQKLKSIDDFEDRYYWKNTTRWVEEEQQKLRTQIQDYEYKLITIIEENKISIKSEKLNYAKNIYEFYNKDNPKIIQFIFQLMLSIFIELIAPFSLMFFISLNAQKIIKLDPIKLRHFSILAWSNIEKNNKKTLTPEKEIIKSGIAKNIDFTKLDYQNIVNIAKRRKLIKKTGINSYAPASEFINSEIFLKKMLKFT